MMRQGNQSGNKISPRIVTSGQQVIPLNGVANGVGSSSGINPNKLPSAPRSVPLHPKTEVTVVSQTSGSKGGEDELVSGELDQQDQTLFEQRLCDDEYGVAVRKINQNGKSNLRYIRCIEVDLMELDDDAPASSNRSVSSISRGSLSFVKGLASRLRSDRSIKSRDRSVERNELTDFSNLLPGGTIVKCLTWGKRKGVKIPLERFTCVRQGKTTDRSKRNMCPSNRILSLITNDPYHRSLDIEAPTKLDRDKFAKAFSKFLKVPLETEENRSTRSEFTQSSRAREVLGKGDTSNNQKNFPIPVVTTSRASPNGLPSPFRINTNDDKLKQQEAAIGLPNKLPTSKDDQTSQLRTNKATVVSPSNKRKSSSADKSAPSRRLELPPADDASAVSSITGVGQDQEIIEELHNALTAMRAELDESRAEAARAVKVAEQAIQSAEKNNSKDWHSTVTHKAAEAAAIAQKKAAAALARARKAEDKLEIERRNAAKLKEQAQLAEEDAGYWRTRAAAAEVEKTSLADSLETERNNTVALLSSMREKRALGSEGNSNRALEAELEILRSTLASRDIEVSVLRECISEIENTPEAYQLLKRKPRFVHHLERAKARGLDGTTHAAQGANSSQSQVEKLRSKLAMETAIRRKLQHEVLDLRGSVRVYCRPRAVTSGVSALSIPSRDVVVLHRDRSGGKMSNATPLSFEFDGVISPDMNQQELYSEVEQVCLNVLEGYNSSIMTYGPSRAGKTFTMLGDVGYSIAADSIEPVLSLNNFGVHLRAARQIFSVIEQRRDRYNDVVSFSVLEVHEEKICDLLVGTDIGESQGRPEVLSKDNRRRADSTCSSSSAMGNSDQPLKLELRTNRDGETCVSGLLAVEVNNFEDICRVWKECLSMRVSRLAEQGIRLEGHDHNCHIIGTMRVSSTNLSTGTGTQGKIQFVDFAASDIFQERSHISSKRGSNPDIPSSVGPDPRFKNKSIAILGEVVQARSQFQRSVPYRNSTITHLLSDSLEGDTKVVIIACVSSDIKDIEETTCTLKFAATMKKVIVGKATTHAIGSK